MNLIQTIEQTITTLRNSALAQKDKALINLVLESLCDAEQRLYASRTEERDVAEELAERISQILSDLYRRQQTYLRLREKIDTAERKSALNAITYLKESSAQLFKDRHAKVIEEFQREHDALTNVREIGRKTSFAGKWIAEQTEKGFNKTVKWVSRDKSYQDSKNFTLDDHDRIEALELEERLIAKHFRKEDIDARLKEFATEAEKTFEAIWRKTSADLDEFLSVQAKFRNQLPHHEIRLELPADLSTIIGYDLLSGTALSSVILAAGWHTIGWTLANLFLPMAVAIAVIYGAVSWWRADTEKHKRTKNLEEQLTKSLEELEHAIEGRVGVMIRRSALSLGNELRGRAVKATLCEGQKRDFDQLIDCLETLQTNLGTLRLRTVGAGKPATTLSQAKDRLEKEDYAGSALLAAVAFEGGLLAWAEERGLLCGPQREGFQHLLIEELHHAGHCNEQTRRRMHDLRRERNRFIHNLPSVLSGANPKTVIEQFITQCRNLVPTLSA